MRYATYIFLAGVILRAVGVFWPETFWFDEQATIYVAKLPIAESFFLDNHPPTFVILLKAWISIFSLDAASPEWTYRLLPFLISTAGLGLFFKRCESNLAGFAMALNPASVFFASEVRHHSLFELACVFFIFQASRYWFAENEKQKSSFAVTIAAFLLIATHFLGLIFAMSFLAMLLLSKDPSKRQKILIFTSCIALVATGILIHHFWIESNYLAWMTRFHQDFPLKLFTEPFLVLGSYSRVWSIALLGLVITAAIKSEPNSAFYSRWFLMFTTFILMTELIFDRSLGFRKFMIPGHILASLAIGLYASQHLTRPKSSNLRWSRYALAALFILGITISTKKIYEDVTRSRAGWKTAAAEECPRVSDKKLLIWGHPATSYYFAHSCAEVSSVLQEGLWVTISATEFDKIKDERFDIAHVRIIEPASSEPIVVFRVSKKAE